MSAQEYFPQHFKRTRPHAKQLVEEFSSLTQQSRLDPKMAARTAGQLIMAGYNKAGIDPKALDRSAFTRELQTSLMYAQWALSGSVVYALEPELVGALAGSHMDEVTLDDLKFPHPCMYVHFGTQEGLNLESGPAVQGAYLLHDDSLRIMLAAPAANPENWTARHGETYELMIGAQHFDLGLEDAIRAALADDVRDIKRARSQFAGHPTAGATLVATANETLRVLEANVPVYQRCVELIANALCYVTAYPDDVRENWQAGTPENLRRLADGGSPREQGRSVSKLNAMGYRRVQRIGGDFSMAAARGELSPHYRRGHWRRQRHGPGNTLTKLIWLSRTRVLGQNLEPSEEPRVYATSVRESAGTLGKKRP